MLIKRFVNSKCIWLLLLAGFTTSSPTRSYPINDNRNYEGYGVTRSERASKETTRSKTLHFESAQAPAALQDNRCWRVDNNVTEHDEFPSAASASPSATSPSLSATSSIKSDDMIFVGYGSGSFSRTMKAYKGDQANADCFPTAFKLKNKDTLVPSLGGVSMESGYACVFFQDTLCNMTLIYDDQYRNRPSETGSFRCWKADEGAIDTHGFPAEAIVTRRPR